MKGKFRVVFEASKCAWRVQHREEIIYDWEDVMGCIYGCRLSAEMAAEKLRKGETP